MKTETLKTVSKVEPFEKKHSFENAPFLTWIGESGGFRERCREKCHILLFPSALGHFSVNNRQKRIKLFRFFNENESVLPGENKTKTLVCVKIF